VSFCILTCNISLLSTSVKVRKYYQCRYLCITEDVCLEKYVFSLIYFSLAFYSSAIYGTALKFGMVLWATRKNVGRNCLPAAEACEGYVASWEREFITGSRNRTPGQGVRGEVPEAE